MGIEPTEDDSHRPPPVLKTGPVTRSGRATAAEGIRFPLGGQCEAPQRKRTLIGPATQLLKTVACDAGLCPYTPTPRDPEDVCASCPRSCSLAAVPHLQARVLPAPPQRQARFQPRQAPAPPR